MQKITPCLWFDNNAEEAMDYYTGIFKDASVVAKAYYGPGSPGPEGSLMTATFKLAGQEFMVLNGGPVFKFSQAISFLVNCETQAEIDYLWEHLSAGGEVQQCGWLIDKFGVTWQIVPTILSDLMSDPDPAKAQRVMQAMLQMVKFDIAGLQRAYSGP